MRLNIFRLFIADIEFTTTKKKNVFLSTGSGATKGGCFSCVDTPLEPYKWEFNFFFFLLAYMQKIIMPQHLTITQIIRDF